MIRKLFSIFCIILVLASCVLPVFCAAEAASLIIGSASVAGLTSAGAAAVSVPIVGAVVLAACAASGAYLYIGNQAKSEGLTRTEWLEEHYPELFTGAFLSGISVTAAGEWLLDEDSAEMLDSFMTDVNGNIVVPSGWATMDGVSGTVIEPGDSLFFAGGRKPVITNTGDVPIYFFGRSIDTGYLISTTECSFTTKFMNKALTSYGTETSSTTDSYFPNYNYYAATVSGGTVYVIPGPYVSDFGELDFGTGISDDYTGFGGALDYFDTSVIDNRNGLMINPDLIDFDDSTFAGTLEADRYAQLYLDWLDGKTAEEAGYDDIVFNPTDVIDPTITTYLDSDIVTDADPVPEASEAVEGETAEETTDDFTLDLKDLFPFCIPFDLYELYCAFNASAVAPAFEWSFTVYGQTYNLEIDLSSFDTVAQVCRTVELIAFCVALCIGTKNLIQGS